MGKILDFIVKKGDGNYICYKTNKVSLDVTDSDILSYDDKPASSKSSSKIAESDLSRVHKVPINERLEKPHALDPRGHSGADHVKTFSFDP